MGNYARLDSEAGSPTNYLFYQCAAKDHNPVANLRDGCIHIYHVNADSQTFIRSVEGIIPCFEEIFFLLMKFGAALFDILAPVFDEIKNDNHRGFDQKGKHDGDNVVFLPLGSQYTADPGNGNR